MVMKKKTRVVQDDKSVIEFLGGAPAVRRKLNLPAKHGPMISMWRIRGVIPRVWRYRMAALASAENIKLPADFLEPALLRRSA